MIGEDMCHQGEECVQRLQSDEELTGLERSELVARARALLTGGLDQMFTGMPEGGWDRATHREQAAVVEEYLDILEAFERSRAGPEVGPVGDLSEGVRTLRERLQAVSAPRRTVYDEGSSTSGSCLLYTSPSPRDS